MIFRNIFRYILGQSYWPISRPQYNYVQRAIDRIDNTYVQYRYKPPRNESQQTSEKPNIRSFNRHSVTLRAHLIEIQMCCLTAT